MNIGVLSDLVTVVVAAGPQPAAQTPVVGSLIDMQGFENVRFLAVLGDVNNGSVLTLRLQGGDRADGSDQGDLVGLLTAAVTADATSADNKAVSLNVVKPGRRYVRPVLTRTAADAAVACVLAELYDHRRPPVPAGDLIASSIRVGV